MKKLILVSLAVLALIFAVGSVGAFDNGSIGFGQLILQCAIAIAVEWLTLKSLNK